MDWLRAEQGKPVWLRPEPDMEDWLRPEQGMQVSLRPGQDKPVLPPGSGSRSIRLAGCCPQVPMGLAWASADS